MGLEWAKPNPDKQVTDTLFDACELLAHTSSFVNCMRRSALSRSMSDTFAAACHSHYEQGKLLFGDDPEERAKQAAVGAKMFRDPKRKAPTEHNAGYKKHRGGHNNGNLLSISPFPCLLSCHPPTVPDSNLVCSSFRPRTGPVTELARGLPEPQQPSAVQAGPAPQEGEEGLNRVGDICAEAFWQKLNHEPFKAGKLARYSDEWSKLTSDWRILREIKGHQLEFKSAPVQERPPFNINFSSKENDVIRNEIDTLLAKGAISVSQHEEGEFISNIFVVEKKESGKFRVILNVKGLNEFVEKHHIKMDTLLSALALIEQGDWMTSIDFTDAYYSIPIDKEFRKFLKFEFEGVLYHYNVLPFGLSSAPRLFTKVLKVPLSVLREKGGGEYSGLPRRHLTSGIEQSSVKRHDNRGSGYVP